MQSFKSNSEDDRYHGRIVKKNISKLIHWWIVSDNTHWNQKYLIKNICYLQKKFGSDEASEVSQKNKYRKCHWGDIDWCSLSHSKSSFYLLKFNKRNSMMALIDHFFLFICEFFISIQLNCHCFTCDPDAGFHLLRDFIYLWMSMTMVSGPHTASFRTTFECWESSHACVHYFQWQLCCFVTIIFFVWIIK